MPTTNAVAGAVSDPPMQESFDNSIGPFTENWGVDFSTRGEARFFGNKYSTAGMKEPGADPSVGHGYGTYTVNAKITGSDAGPAIMLWPGDNKYPGAEIDFAELKPDGTGRQYATVHWNDNGQNGQTQYFFDEVQSGVFHDYQLLWEPGKMTLSVDGSVVALVTEHVPVDYAHGGMDEVFAFLNNNDATSLVVRDVSFVPLGGTAAAPAPTPAPVAAAIAPTPGPPAAAATAYAFADAHQAEAARLYDTAFDRNPDRDGLAFWRGALNAGNDLAEIADVFVTAPEFQAKYGALDNAGFVAQLYRNVLDREGESGGRTFWTSALDEHRADRAGIVVGFSESSEHAAKVVAGDWVL